MMHLSEDKTHHTIQTYQLESHLIVVWFIVWKQNTLGEDLQTILHAFLFNYFSWMWYVSYYLEMLYACEYTYDWST